ncbi:hypothetical protein RI367_000033 [Sorochytrium milnesiophthora]
MTTLFAPLRAQIRTYASRHPAGYFENTRGRAIAATTNPNVAYRQMNRILAQNNWRLMVRDALYFEKPCEKRKRLVREASEKIFKQQVGVRVNIAKRMTELGY